MKKFEAKYFWLSVPAIIALVSIIRVWPVLPAVMQDEYIYSTQARFVPFAEQAFPNYLFSWLYSNTSVCGLGYYDCAKGLNAVFFFGTLFMLWVIANRLFGNGVGVFIASITALSPVSVYVSYFMPESMYFFFISVTIWLALRAARSSSWHNWLFVALALGLTSLVKPHALFALPAFIIFGLVASRKAEGSSWGNAILQQASVLAGFFVVKLGLGFAFAGLSGVTLLGNGYGDSLASFIDKVAIGTNAVVNLASGQNVIGFSQLAAEVVAQSPIEIFSSITGMQMLAQVSLVLLLAGLPLLLSLRVLKTVSGSKSPMGEQSAFTILIGLIAGAMLITVPVFQGLVSALGDDHSNRMLLRYYEFLMPFLVLLGFSLTKFVEPTTKSRIWQSVVVVAGAIFALVWIPANIETNFSDSITIIGLLAGPAPLPIFFAITLIAIFIWQIKPELGGKILAWGAIPLIALLVGQLAQSELINRVGTQKAFFDVAGQAARPLLEGIPGEKIVVVGTTRTFVFTSKFWIDKPYIADKLIAEDGVIADDFLAGYDYALILGNSTLQNPKTVLGSGDRYSLVKLIP